MAEAHYRLGVCYLELKKPDAAIAAFRRALRGRGLKLVAECRYRLGHTLRLPTLCTTSTLCRPWRPGVMYSWKSR